MESSVFENNTMKYILAINRHGNLTKAAEELFITQSALSKFLTNLEGKLGFVLFNRFGRKLVPTYEGSRFLHYAFETNMLEQQLAHEISDIENRNTGRLRFAVPLLRTPYILPHIVPQFIKTHPAVQLSIIEEHSNTLERLILDDKVDLALINRETKNPGIVRHNIRKNHLYIAVPKTHKIVEQCEKSHEWPAEIDIALFKDDAFILQHRGQQTRELAEFIFEQAGITPKVLLTTRSIPAAMGLVACGCGICFLADVYVNVKTDPPLQIFRIKNPYPALDIALAYRKNIYMPQYFHDFIDIVIHNL